MLAMFDDVWNDVWNGGRVQYLESPLYFCCLSNNLSKQDELLNKLSNNPVIQMHICKDLLTGGAVLVCDGLQTNDNFMST